VCNWDSCWRCHSAETGPAFTWLGVSPSWGKDYCYDLRKQTGCLKASFCQLVSYYIYYYNTFGLHRRVCNRKLGYPRYSSHLWNKNLITFWEWVWASMNEPHRQRGEFSWEVKIHPDSRHSIKSNPLELSSERAFFQADSLVQFGSKLSRRIINWRGHHAFKYWPASHSKILIGMICVLIFISNSFLSNWYNDNFFL
jgi:hypothetical protein